MCVGDATGNDGIIFSCNLKRFSSANINSQILMYVSECSNKENVLSTATNDNLCREEWKITKLLDTKG